MRTPRTERHDRNERCDQVCDSTNRATAINERATTRSRDGRRCLWSDVEKLSGDNPGGGRKETNELRDGSERREQPERVRNDGRVIERGQQRAAVVLVRCSIRGVEVRRRGHLVVLAEHLGMNERTCPRDLRVSNRRLVVQREQLHEHDRDAETEREEPTHETVAAGPLGFLHLSCNWHGVLLSH